MANRDNIDNATTRVSVETTDVTLTAVASYTPPNNSITLIDINLAGCITNNSSDKGLRSRRHVVVTKDGTGGMNVRGSVSLAEEWGTSGYLNPVGTTGGAIEVRVQGANSETVAWVGRVTFDVYEQAISSGG